MIYGQIEAKETGAAYSKTILEGLEFLRKTDFSEYHQGRYELDGDRMYVLCNEYTTKPREEKRPEFHRRYLDIQYVVSGQECIGWYPDLGGGTVTEDRLEKSDVAFYAERDDSGEVALPLHAGTYCVFFPEDVHRPGCVFGEPCEVKKIVLKIRLSDL